jgi:hypothetical protein
MPEVVAAWLGLDPSGQDLAVLRSTGIELAEARIAATDEIEISIQVLSLTTPGGRYATRRLGRAATWTLHRPQVQRQANPCRSSSLITSTCELCRCREAYRRGT